MEDKIRRIKASKEKYREKYDEITARQCDICDMDFRELLKNLQEGSLLAFEVLEAFMAKAARPNTPAPMVAPRIELP